MRSPIQLDLVWFIITEMHYNALLIHRFINTRCPFHILILGQDIDEDELERELEELEQEELDKDLLGVGPSTQDLPEVPTAEPAKEPAASSKEKKKGECK